MLSDDPSSELSPLIQSIKKTKESLIEKQSSIKKQNMLNRMHLKENTSFKTKHELYIDACEINV